MSFGCALQNDGIEARDVEAAEVEEQRAGAHGSCCAQDLHRVEACQGLRFTVKQVLDFRHVALPPVIRLSFFDVSNVRSETLKHAKLRKPLLQVRRSRADSIARLRASLAFRCADGVCRAQCIAPAKRSRADVFEKRKAILLAVYNKDAAERKRRIVAMRLQTDKLGEVHALVEQVARSGSAKAAREVVAQRCA